MARQERAEYFPVGPLKPAARNCAAFTEPFPFPSLFPRASSDLSSARGMLLGHAHVLAFTA